MNQSVDGPLREPEPGWSRAYGFVFAFFVLEIALLYFFTIRFS